ncbi:hypothetical protein JIN85_06910 [Luteolibacter pohnpeiensis]|uniref:Rod shape-determining protein MreD n=1 Tax=Luteolibacter pohnpeiensis TaxID=454153 RepID=A0A934S7C2_9BACT|nr:hypothetical protein [Luteolibacter pohnpeiensis]MBK1882136.1 hypothetical protein [Luteolibacter pohnpeiensis]
MIRYTITTVLLVLASFVVQQFIPAFTGFHQSRILLVQLVFLCSAVTVGSPTMLLLAFISGFLWDTQSYIGTLNGDPQIYTQPVESLRFGYSILLFAAMGYLMQGVQPLFHQGKWQFSVVLSGIAIFLYLMAEYLIICFVRGGMMMDRFIVIQMACTALLTMLFSPIVFWILFRIAALCRHSINPAAAKKKNRRRRR